MQMIDGAALARLLPWDRLVGALAETFREGCEAPPRHRHAIGRDGTLLLMPAWDGAVTGVKIVHVLPAARPAVQAVYLLSDAASGAPLALLDGAELTDRRTAAASALAAAHLARPDATRLLILGSGRIARALAECHAATRRLDDIAIWSRNAGHAARLAATLAAHGLPAHAVASRDPRGFGIVAAATLATDPLIEGAALDPGTHLDLVGAFRPDMREADAAAIARARLFVDTRPGALAEAGDILQAIEEGAITSAHVEADLAELVRGAHPGRRSAAEITCFKSVGWAGEDLAAARLAYAALSGSA